MAYSPLWVQGRGGAQAPSLEPGLGIQIQAWPPGPLLFFKPTEWKSAPGWWAA